MAGSADRFRAAAVVLALLGAVLAALGFAAPASAARGATAYTVHSFVAAGYDGVSPGDPNLAVGPTYIVETLNTAMTVYTKSGVKPSPRFPAGRWEAATSTAG